jgi:hypothetical protein
MGFREEYLRPDSPSYIQPIPGQTRPPATQNAPKFSNEQLMWGINRGMELKSLSFLGGLLTQNRSQFHQLRGINLIYFYPFFGCLKGMVPIDNLLPSKGKCRFGGRTKGGLIDEVAGGINLNI